MATKVVKRSVTQIEYGLQSPSGQWTAGPVQRDIVSEVTARAVFSRPYPLHCLTHTEMHVADLYSNPEVYSNPSGSSVRVGDAQWAYRLGAAVRANSDDGSLALLRARAKFSEFNFGETLVEFGETVGLVNKTLGTLFRGFSYLKNGQWGKLGRLWDNPGSLERVRKLPPSKRIAKGYLEYQFGWSPLVSDVYSAVDAYTKGLGSVGDKVRKRSGRAPMKASNPSSISSPLEATATASGIVSNPVSAGLNQLGLLNPALMAWNALPFSFLIDWFVPVSTVLGSLTAGAGLGCYNQSVSTYQRTVVFTRDAPDVIVNNQIVGDRRVVMGTMALNYQRQISLSTGQITSGVALLRTLL